MKRRMLIWEENLDIYYSDHLSGDVKRHQVFTILQIENKADSQTFQKFDDFENIFPQTL